jgi:hypothetical protein
VLQAHLKANGVRPQFRTTISTQKDRALRNGALPPFDVLDAATTANKPKPADITLSAGPAHTETLINSKGVL